MKHMMFAIKDKAADAFLPPFFLPTESMALREFAYCAQDPTHKFCQHKTDFSLYKLGSFEDGNGVVTPLAEPMFMLSADGVAGEPVMPNSKGH